MSARSVPLGQLKNLNPLDGLALIAFAAGFTLVALFTRATGWLEGALFVGSILLVPVLVWAGLTLLVSPASGIDRRALGVGTGIYAGIGVAFTAIGMPGYIGPGYAPMLAMWPFYLIWLHACPTGVGLWPCPSG